MPLNFPRRGLLRYADASDPRERQLALEGRPERGRDRRPRPSRAAAAREAARQNGDGRKTKQKPQPVRTVRRDGPESMGASRAGQSHGERAAALGQQSGLGGLLENGAPPRRAAGGVGKLQALGVVVPLLQVLSHRVQYGARWVCGFGVRGSVQSTDDDLGGLVAQQE